MTYAKKILTFLGGLELDVTLPKGIEVMNPFTDSHIFGYCKKFYAKYYNTTQQRTLIVGINPGRFGGGLTGIPFTDPIKLENECGIENDLPKKAELSADFIYQMINTYGGKKAFYDRYYFSSVSPLGFTQNGKNLNYYDLPQLQKKTLPFIIDTLNAQIKFGLNRKVAYCLGEGKNYKFLSKLNQQHSFFEHIIPLSHPRFIMQYRRKKIAAFIDDYLAKLHQPELFVS